MKGSEIAGTTVLSCDTLTTSHISTQNVIFIFPAYSEGLSAGGEAAGVR